MSKYTTEVRFVCENAAGLTESVGYDDIDEVLTAAWDTIFNDTWDIYDETYRSVLCMKILRHYYTREICAETVGLWKHWLNERMCIIMPYYNQLYETTLYDFNPLYEVDLYEKTDGTKVDAETSSTTTDETSDTEFNTERNVTETIDNDRGTTTTSEHADTISDTNVQSGSRSEWNYYSDTPQGGISGIANKTYLTNAYDNEQETSLTTQDDVTDTGKTTSTVKDAIDATNKTADTGGGTSTTERDATIAGTRDLTSTDDYLKHIYGKANNGKSYAQLLLELRSAIINIDEMIIEELSDLFFTLW